MENSSSTDFLIWNREKVKKSKSWKIPTFTSSSVPFLKQRRKEKTRDKMINVAIGKRKWGLKIGMMYGEVQLVWIVYKIVWKGEKIIKF